MSILEQKRREYNLTRKELSILTGIPVRTIEAYEQGLRKTERMEIRSAIKLSEILHISINDFITEG